MINIRKAEDRGHANYGWLDTHYSFSFADYHDPKNMGFRNLRVINDDTVAGGGGFDTHPHRDMEIITYVLSGALQHKDSMGNGRIIRPGEVQYMAAGTGIAHSEFNPSPLEPVHLLQIWIVPDRRGTKPRYAEKSLAKAQTGQLHLVTSKSGRDGSIAINQDAEMFVAKLGVGDSVSHALKPDRNAWVQVAEGEVVLNGQTLKAGDGAAVTGEPELSLRGNQPSQVILFDMN
jgi:quercetin 2,3-dioxygenase